MHIVRVAHTHEHVALMLYNILHWSTALAHRAIWLLLQDRVSLQ
jgi:hypothetical protein